MLAKKKGNGHAVSEDEEAGKFALAAALADNKNAVEHLRTRVAELRETPAVSDSDISAVIMPAGTIRVLRAHLKEHCCSECEHLISQIS